MMCCTTLAAICTAVAATRLVLCKTTVLQNSLRELAIRSNKIVRCGIWTISGVIQRFLRTHRHECGNAAAVSLSSHNKVGHAQSHGLTRPCDKDSCESVRRTAGPGTTWGPEARDRRRRAACRTAADTNRNLAPPRRRRREATTGDSVDAKESRIKADYKNTHAYVRDSTVDATSGAPWAGSP